jgi:hypothetical protein
MQITASNQADVLPPACDNRKIGRADFGAARDGCLIKLSRRCHRFVMHES